MPLYYLVVGKQGPKMKDVVSADAGPAKEKQASQEAPGPTPVGHPGWW
jgi:uncharacterized protein (TIGR03435 family)